MDVIIKDLGLLINATLIATPPLLFAALGSCFSERCGVVNIGIEGMMTIGAFTGASRSVQRERLACFSVCRTCRGGLWSDSCGSMYIISCGSDDCRYRYQFLRAWTCGISLQSHVR